MRDVGQKLVKLRRVSRSTFVAGNLIDSVSEFVTLEATNRIVQIYIIVFRVISRTCTARCVFSKIQCIYITSKGCSLEKLRHFFFFSFLNYFFFFKNMRDLEICTSPCGLGGRIDPT